MKSLLISLVIVSSLISFFSCNKNTDLKIVKEERCYEHNINAGVIDSLNKKLLFTLQYNEKGNIFEDIPNESILNITKKTYKYNTSDKLIEITEYSGNEVRRKKIYDYNSLNQKSLVRIYFGNEAKSEGLPLWAAMRLYYNEFGKVKMKKWVGGMNHLEEEQGNAIDSEGNFTYSKKDSCTAYYFYGKNKKLDSVKVTSPTKWIAGKDYYDLIKYKYDKNDSLVEKASNSYSKFYTYANGKLIEEKKVEASGLIELKKYNDFGKLSELVVSDPNDSNQNHRVIFQYNENQNEVKRIGYNYMNEPFIVRSSEYLYY